MYMYTVRECSVHFAENRCPPLPNITHAHPADASLEVSLESKHEMVCEEGFYFKPDEKSRILVCDANLQWAGDLEPCSSESKFTEISKCSLME